MRQRLIFFSVVAFLALEFLLFDQFGAKHHTWVYPRWNDQIQYLTESYTGYETARELGFFPGLRATVLNRSAQGTLHDFFAVLMFWLTGPSRSAALSLNFLAFVGWQIAIFLAIGHATRSRALAFGAMCLPLALRWPWESIPGSAYDFRLDHPALCLIGLSLAIAWRTERFAARGWSVAFGIAVGLTLLTRFLTGTYFVLIFLALLGWIVAARDLRFRRVGNLLLAAAATAAMTAPIFWLNRETVWNYYAIGHFTGPESAIRNPNMGVIASTTYLWKSLFTRHAGTTFWIASAMAAFVLAASRFDRRSTRESTVETRAIGIPSLIFLLSPALILTLHQQKSELVINALIPGLVGLVLTGWLALDQKYRSTRMAWIAAAVVAGITSWYFAGKQLRSPHGEHFVRDARKVNQLADYIYRKAKTTALTEPRIAVDQVTDSLDAQITRVVTYERHGEFVPFIMTLPTGIGETSETTVFERLEQSDFVFITEAGPITGWPFDRQLRALQPQTQAWCEQNLRRVEAFTLFDRRMVLYQRREIP